MADPFFQGRNGRLSSIFCAQNYDVLIEFVLAKKMTLPKATQGLIETAIPALKWTVNGCFSSV